MTQPHSSSRESSPAHRPPGPGRRLGPRPLPLHLATAWATWNSSPAGLPLLSADSPIWKHGAPDPDREAAREKLRADLENQDPSAVLEALQSEILRRHKRLLDGLEAYRRHPYERTLEDPPILWSEGSTRLLRFAAEGKTQGPPVLAVPSLINRAYILDLDEETSLMRHLARQGVESLLLDWAAPGPVESGFSLTDYICGRLEAALDAVREAYGRPPVVVGYCMGGLLALALAERRTEDIAGLVLMATPWDFHAEQADLARQVGAQVPALAPVLDSLGAMPTDMVQSYFALLDPVSVLRKFMAFAELDPTSEKARRFVALEDWLNDGVPLAAPVARECLGGWYGENQPALGNWRVAGHPVGARPVDLPSLVLVPQHDRIVPPASAEAAAAILNRPEIIRPPLGHIGMVVAGRAKSLVWGPLIDWIKARE